MENLSDRQLLRINQWKKLKKFNNLLKNTVRINKTKQILRQIKRHETNKIFDLVRLPSELAAKVVEKVNWMTVYKFQKANKTLSRLIEKYRNQFKFPVDDAQLILTEGFAGQITGELHSKQLRYGRPPFYDFSRIMPSNFKEIYLKSIVKTSYTHSLLNITIIKGFTPKCETLIVDEISSRHLLFLNQFVIKNLKCTNVKCPLEDLLKTRVAQNCETLHLMVYGPLVFPLHVYRLIKNIPSVYFLIGQQGIAIDYGVKIANRIAHSYENGDKLKHFRLQCEKTPGPGVIDGNSSYCIGKATLYSIEWKVNCEVLFYFKPAQDKIILSIHSWLDRPSPAGRIAEKYIVDVYLLETKEEMYVTMITYLFAASPYDGSEMMERFISAEPEQLWTVLMNIFQFYSRQ